MPQTIRIATRVSELALWQTQWVCQQLTLLYPEYQFELVKLSSKGDQILDKPLADIGGKGLFVKCLEQALLDDRADIAVHSLKDVPGELDDSFTLAAYCKRANPVDVLISPRYHSLDNLPQGAIIGTSSPRRRAMLKAFRPDFKFILMRGNVPTRLEKLASGQCDALVLAAAGLERLQRHKFITESIDTSIMLPAAGQGCVAIETLSTRSDMTALMQSINDPDSQAQALAERAVIHHLRGDCHSAIGAHAQIQQGQLYLKARVLDATATVDITINRQSALSEAEPLGIAVAEALIEQGAQSALAT